ncbi:MAG: cyclic nucleotide-binding domain-containing protein [Desulfobulbaceae bacterium]|nr:cyclic nucleotide-binding domain-containing protein [Desulfobulbaceae bacterium]HIJ91047.1 cyclic nucleotide-binding domain-containing protein [Deltaproteobacteria bacterium]
MQESPYLESHAFLVDKLQRLPLLGSLSEKYIKHILRLSKIRTFEHSEIITPEGAYDNWVYILLSGGVRIVKNHKEIARIEEIGGTFGELAAIDGKSRSASVEAIGATVCLAIDTSFMNEAAEPLEQALFVSVLYRLFAEVIAQHLRTANEELVRVRSELDQLKRNQRQ